MLRKFRDTVAKLAHHLCLERSASQDVVHREIYSRLQQRGVAEQALARRPGSLV